RTRSPSGSAGNSSSGKAQFGIIRLQFRRPRRTPMATLTKPASQKKTPAVPANLKQYIGGKWIEGVSDRVVISTNPADSREVLAKFKSADKAQALAAIEAAKKAFPAWKATTPP